MQEQYDYGMIGLGTMGRNLVYNICDHGFSVAGFDKKTAQVDMLMKEAGGKKVLATQDLAKFLESLKQPRVIMMLVPAGPIVDAVIADLKPHLSKDDLLMDCGNSHFTDTDRRIASLQKENIHFMGVGVSGGESGARYGPSIMPGGSRDSWRRVSAMLESVAAKVDNEPCVGFLGNGSSGHYVKMVHNGIEYGIMQLITETYHLLKKVGGLSNDELQEVFVNWNRGRLQSFLIEITATVLGKKDDLTDHRLVDVILDTAHQKGTGQWTSQNALDLHVPIPTIDAAVTARGLSALKKERVEAARVLTGPGVLTVPGKRELIDAAENALFFSLIVTYAQGMALLQQASTQFNYGLDLQQVATIWRGGCIIRSVLLEDIRQAYKNDPSLVNLMTSEGIAAKLMEAQAGARSFIQTGVSAGIPLACAMACLAYFDAYRSAWLPANLLQGQRDYFGAHTYERNDREGTFHTHWN